MTRAFTLWQTNNFQIGSMIEMCNTEGPPSPIIDADLSLSIILDDRIIAAMPVSNGKPFELLTKYLTAA